MKYGTVAIFFLMLTVLAVVIAQDNGDVTETMPGGIIWEDTDVTGAMVFCSATSECRWCGRIQNDCFPHTFSAELDDRKYEVCLYELADMLDRHGIGGWVGEKD